MLLNDLTVDILKKLMSRAVADCLTTEDYREACHAMNVVKLYYDMDLGDPGRYRDHTTNKLIIDGLEQNGMIILYDSGLPKGDTVMFTYYYEGKEFVHAYIDLRKGLHRCDIDHDEYNFVADCICVLASRDNMRKMLDFAEMSDAQSGIPNIMYITKNYNRLLNSGQADNYVVICFNLQNFKYLNEAGGSRCGDEAIIRYSRMLMSIIDRDECVCRMGGDNFAAYIRRDHLDEIIGILHSFSVSRLESAPNRTFELSAWIGISGGLPDHDPRPFSARLNEASTACNVGKSRLKQSVVFFSEELKMMMNRGREIMAMFYPAVKNREFHPFFQAKVDMSTGRLVGFEALCRWIHEGRFIFPDQFIPILDKEGLIHDLDMAIFRETCIAIRRWKDMGLHPPRISSNFSRKNLFVPDIEKMIYNTIHENGISVDDVEIEITESVQEAETTRLIEFVRNLKRYGLHISIDDFGTGYSSLMLIHNIDADILKIDKSFVDEIPGDHKSEVLIESIIGIARNLNMSLIAEGVETAEQGKALMRLGCMNAQGYYYSKPVDYEAATELIRCSPFRAIG